MKHDDPEITIAFVTDLKLCILVICATLEYLSTFRINLFRYATSCNFNVNFKVMIKQENFKSKQDVKINVTFCFCHFIYFFIIYLSLLIILRGEEIISIKKDVLKKNLLLN